MDTKSSLKKANTLFAEGYYKSALSEYKKLLEDDSLPESSEKLKEQIKLNIYLTKKAIAKKNKHAKIAIVAHLYYEHLIEDLLKKIKAIECIYDLFISVPTNKKDKFQKKIKAHFNNAKILCTENIGMDVLPFIEIAKKCELSKYHAILKLHTKSDRTAVTKTMTDVIHDSLLKSNARISNILNVFYKEKNVGIIAPYLLLRSSNDLMYNNRNKVTQLLELTSQTQQLGHSVFSAGTMFWCSGKLLKPIEENYDKIKIFFNNDNETTSGGDGTYAHAFERLFGLLASSLNLKVYGSLALGKNDKKSRLIEITKNHVLDNDLFISGSTKILHRYSEIEKTARTVSKSSLFDHVFYKNKTNSSLEEREELAAHFILFEKEHCKPPSKNFNSNYYNLRYKDISRLNIPSLYHYLTKGKQEGRKALPNDSDWIELAQRDKLIPSDHDFNDNTNIFNLDNEKNSAFTNNYSPKKIPILAPLFDKLSNTQILKIYLDGVYQQEERLFDLIERCWDNCDYAHSIFLSNKYINLYGNNKPILEVLAASYTLTYNWELAKTQWAEYWSLTSDTGSVPVRIKKSILKLDKPTLDYEDFIQVNTITEKDKNSTLIKNNKICVYTTLFGDFDELQPISAPPPNIDFIVFSDRPVTARGWNNIIVTPAFDCSNLSAKIYKVLPYKHLKNYDFSMFVDANTLFLGRLNYLLDICLSNGDFIMWKHPYRKDIYKEAIAIIVSKRHSPAPILNQLRSYYCEGVPHDSGMVEASFIWRSHTNKKINQLMDNWWDEILKNTKRDQLSLTYLMWKTGIKPLVFPDWLGDSRHNSIFYKTPHNFEKQKPITQKKEPAIQKTRPSSKRDIYFLYSKNYAKSGSTIMRGQQLSNIIKKSNLVENSIYYSPFNTNISDSIIILTKGVLKEVTLDQLELLNSNNNVILSDYVDEIPNPNQIPFFHGLIASSLNGYRSFLAKFSSLPTFHITHHVDPRVSTLELNTSNNQSLNIGYFGEIVNCHLTSRIEKEISTIHIDTSKQHDGWIEELHKYNMHYAVRNRRAIDGYKPFLKCFTAAAVGSNIITSEDESDAIYYLGSDYPFLLPPNPTEDKIISAFTEAKERFGDSSWRYAQEIMTEVRNRSSNQVVANEFKLLIDSI